MRFRRAKPLACYWDGGRLVARNYYSGQESFLPTLAGEVLAYCDTWRTSADVCAKFDLYPPQSIRGLLTLLTKLTLLDRSSGTSRRSDPLAAWSEWMPEGAFFHFATKNVEYVDAEVIRQKLLRKARHEPAPSPVKRYPNARRTILPRADGASHLAQVLRERRTWRRFSGRKALPLAHAATLLGLTWGVQRWVRTALGTFALKTSPSGGGRHPIEVYLLARRVEGLAVGWYHYDPDAHALELIARGARVAGPLAYLPSQVGWRAAPAVFVMSAMFTRAQWAYATSRAYRVVLLDAGHLGQTFCLVATALGLAPFCSAALADSRLERDLGLDGVSESVIYACGVGVRPVGVAWAPWPDDRPLPQVLPPTSAKITRKR